MGTAVSCVAYPHHLQNSFATCTPAVDAERLYLLWRAGETVTLTALTHRRPRNLATRRQQIERAARLWGLARAGGRHGVRDQRQRSGQRFDGVDQKTGEIRWRVSRPTGQSSFSTPCLLDAVGGKKLLVTASTGGGLVVVDPTSGKTAWQMLEQDLPQRCVSSPIVAGGLVLVSCGLTNNGLHLIAVKPGVGGNRRRRCTASRRTCRTCRRQIVVGDLLFLWHDGGTVACHDLATGKEILAAACRRHFPQFAGLRRRPAVLHVAGGRNGRAGGRQEVPIAGAIRTGRAFSATPAVAQIGCIFARSRP